MILRNLKGHDIWSFQECGSYSLTRLGEGTSRSTRYTPEEWVNLNRAVQLFIVFPKEILFNDTALRR